MDKLELLIEEILLWGSESRQESAGNPPVLEKQLVALYHLYLAAPDLSDDKEYPEPPRLPGDYIATAKENFPGFGYYNVCLNILESSGQYENGIGDAADDVLDILRDLWEVNWYFKNTSPENAVFQFKLLFRIHTKAHILGLLNYLNELFR